MDRIDWNQLFMTMAYLVGQRSPDPSSKFGAVVVSADNIVVSAGYNGWPRGMKPFADDDPRWQRPDKYLYMEHAERNAIYNATRNGVALHNCTLYVPVMTCSDCARAVIQAGITRVVVHAPACRFFRQGLIDAQPWQASCATAEAMLNECGVALKVSDCEIMPIKTLLCGREFDPTTHMRFTVSGSKSTPEQLGGVS